MQMDTMRSKRVKKMSRRGILTVISGFSGAGKGTLVKALMQKYNNYALSISATTRQPRPGEEHGREYFFKTIEEFREMIAEGMMIEYAQYVQNYYGTPKDYVEEQLNRGKDVILEIEIQGALRVKDKFPDTLLLFITPPNAKTLEKRLVGRGTETEQIIRERLCRASEEALGMEQYDYLVVNDVLETCVEDTHAIIQSEHYRAERNTGFIKELKEELKCFAK